MTVFYLEGTPYFPAAGWHGKQWPSSGYSKRPWDTGQCWLRFLIVSNPSHSSGFPQCTGHHIDLLEIALGNVVVATSDAHMTRARGGLARGKKPRPVLATYSLR